MGVVKIEVQEHGDVCVLRVSGEIALGASTQALRKKTLALVQSGERKLVLDMLNVPWLDSSGIGEVFACYKRARERGGVVKLVLKGKSRSLFTFTELHRVCEIFEDLASAVASFDARPS